MAVIMREAIKPNLLQTLEHTPVIVHAGPFGNIAHGNSSIVGDLIGIRGGDYLITEAGFGADMGAERFFNIKCRNSGMTPDAAVLVATVRALKAHSGKFKIVPGKPLPADLLAENPDDVRAGAANLIKQIENVKVHGVSPVVAINAFPGDFASEHAAIREIAESVGARVAVCDPLQRRRQGCDRARPGRGRGVRRAEHLPVLLRERHDAEAEDRGRGHEDLRRRERHLLGRRQHPAGATRRTASARCPCASRRPTCRSRADASLKGAPTGHTVNVREARASRGCRLRVPDLW
jgi:formate--tetrahydrofolate ligase